MIYIILNNEHFFSIYKIKIKNLKKLHMPLKYIQIWSIKNSNFPIKFERKFNGT